LGLEKVNFNAKRVANYYCVIDRCR